MKDNQGRVVGIVKGTSAKGNKFTKISMVGEYDEYIENFEGEQAEEVYISGDVKDINIGDIVELKYGKGFEGKAVVKGVTIIG